VVCDPNRRPGTAAADGTPVLIDASCFARPARGDFGNAQRNLLRRPGVQNWDIALFKNVRIAERRNVQFRWETYNVFNHTNFSNLDSQLRFDAAGNQINARFGQPTQARSPRVMQASLRLSF